MLSLIAAGLLCQLDHVGASAAPDPLGRGAWLADATEDAVLLATPRAGVERFAGCAWPAQLVVDSQGTAYVSCRAGGEVQRLRSREPVTAWSTGAEPAALALDEAARRLYVGLATSNAVAVLDADTGSELARIDVGVEPTAVALFRGGLAVASRKSDQVQVFERGLGRRVRTLKVEVPQLDPVFPVSVGADRFVPAGDGLLLLAPVAEVGNIDEPTYYASTRGSPVTQELFVLDEVPAPKLRRVRNLVLPDVSGAFYDAASGTLKVTSRGVGGLVTVRLDTGAASLEWRLPTGVAAMANDGRSTFVLDDADREIRVRANGGGVETVALGGGGDAELARGRMLFHRADDRHISDVPLACASCHRDGRDDGRTWLGQAGMRQTPMLAGRDIAHTAPYGWSGKYERLEDYIDFTIRERMFGAGLPKADLHALARYVSEGLRPVARPGMSGELRAAVQRGRVVFHAGAAGCSTCHGAESAFTDGEAHDVGSLGREEKDAWLRSQPRKGTVHGVSAGVLIASGVSPGGQVAGSVGTIRPTLLAAALFGIPASIRRFDTPSLRQVGLTAPYLHDGSAASLEQVFSRLGDHMGTVSVLGSRERSDLIAYLRTL